MPSVPIGFGARSVGVADFRAGWVHGPGTITWTNVYWCVSGQVGLLANDERCLLERDHVVIHPPGTRISGYPNETAGGYRWVTFDGPLGLKVIEQMGFPISVPFLAGRCPMELFDQLSSEIQDVTAAGEYRASATGYEILVRIASLRCGKGEGGSEDRLAGSCVKIIEERFCDSELTVGVLARELGVHRSQLSRVFGKATGLSPSAYIQRLRLRRALSLLSQKGMTVREIAFACGFSDPAYFSRCISNEFGVSPKALRRSL